MLSLLLPFVLRINCGVSLFTVLMLPASHFKKLILGMNVFIQCDREKPLDKYPDERRQCRQKKAEELNSK
jgi:hypothetical protein